MNRIKTFFYYLGFIILGNLLIKTIGSINNYDFFPDVIYVPIMALMYGYLPFTIAAKIALDTTNNKDSTRKILWRWKMFIAISYSLFGLTQFFFGLYLGVPMFEFIDEIGYFTPPPNHWLHNLPVGLIGIYAALRIKNKKEEEEII